MKLLSRAAYRFGARNRARKASFAIEVGRGIAAETVLLVGVDVSNAGTRNLVERCIAAEFSHVTASGLHPDSGGWKHYIEASGLDLPFDDDQFDLVYSNAVIEHVGVEAEQRRFVAELDRVGRSWILTTPNRFFPVEAHRHTLLTHWKPGWHGRGSVTRLLGRRDLAALLPGGQVRGLPVLSPTLTAFRIAD